MPDDHDAILRDWEQNAARDEDRNFRFLHSLKMVDDPEQIDTLARDLHEEAFTRIDCTRCAHCCKTMRPTFTDEDVNRIADHFSMTAAALIAAHLEIDPEEHGHRPREMPCPFLGEDDRCTIYAVRPQACREFPHTNKEGFIWRIYLHTENTLTCPGVYRIVKQMRRRLRRR
jgi:Fe-S-cluster containining protein